MIRGSPTRMKMSLRRVTDLPGAQARLFSEEETR
jgi:hypothetical protein